MCKINVILNNVHISFKKKQVQVNKRVSLKNYAVTYEKTEIERVPDL